SVQAYAVAEATARRVDVLPGSELADRSIGRRDPRPQLEHRVGGALEVQLGLPPHGRRPRHAATEARAVVLGEGALLRGGEREARGHLRNGTSSAVVTESSAGVTESRA